MKPFKIITLLLVFSATYAQAQKSTKSSSQTRTIEINNDKGDLSISFENGTITKFIVNDTPVSKDKYDDYQAIIDDFSDEKAQPTPPKPPSPSPPNNADQSEELQTAISKYLTSKEVIKSTEKYNIHLKSNFLKVDGQKLSSEMHNACLDIFNDIYDQRLNKKSEVKFRKSKNRSRSSINIVD